MVLTRILQLSRVFSIFLVNSRETALRIKEFGVAKATVFVAI